MAAFQADDEVYWWRRITRSIDYRYPARILVVGEKRIKISVQDVADEAVHVIRQVAANTLRRREVFYEKAPNQRPAILEPALLWGKRTIYLKIGDDLQIVGGIEIFVNGNMLSYDRVHWIDAFGTLGGARITRNRKSGLWGCCEEIERVEFENVWKLARESNLWSQQVATAQMEELGALPIWLTAKGWRPAPLSRSE